MLHRQVAVAGLTLGLLLTTTTASRAQTTLRYKFKKGDKLQYVLEQKGGTKLSAKAFNAGSTHHHTIDMTWTVKDAESNKATVSVKFERLQFLFADAEEKITFDSREGKELEGSGKELGPVLKALAALEFDMTVDTRGKLEGIQLSEQSAEAVKRLADTPGSDLLSLKELHRTMNQAFMSFPAEAIKPGATWKQSRTNKWTYGTLRTDQAFEYKGMKDRGGKMLAEIAIKPTFSVDTVENATTVTIKQQQADATAYFDPDIGRLTEARLTRSITLRIVIRGLGMTSEDRETVSMKLRDALPSDRPQPQPVQPRPAFVTVRVPAADAEVWFDGKRTQQTGVERSFESPALEPGKYSYQIRAKWRQDGKDVEQTRTVEVQPGQRLTLDFKREAARADEKDDWTGEWVLPRNNTVPFRDKDGKSLDAMFASAGKVLATEKTLLHVRSSQGRGPHQGFVSKTDVVKSADAEAFFSNAIRADGKSTWAWRMRGQARLVKKEYDSAVKDFTEAIRLDPKDANAFLCRGNAWGLKGNFNKAIKDFDEAVRLDPKNALAFGARGLARAQRGEFGKAMKDFDEAIRLDPKEAGVFSNRATTWLQRGDFDKAIKDYTEAIRLDPNDVALFGNRGAAWVHKKEYDKAIKDYTAAIRLDPRSADAFTARGSSWAYKGEYDKAIKDYTEAIRLDPQRASAFSGRGGVWAAKKDYDKANKDLTKAIRLNPQDALAFNNRGNVWHRKKEYDKAIKDYTKSLRLDPDNVSFCGRET